MARDDRAWPCRRVRGLAYLHGALRNRGHRCVRPWWAHRGHHRVDPRATRRRVVPAPHRTREPPVAVAGDELVVPAVLVVAGDQLRHGRGELLPIGVSDRWLVDLGGSGCVTLEHRTIATNQR